MKYLLSCSIVTYCNNLQMLEMAINSILSSSLKLKLFIFDNSPDPVIKEICTDQRILYIHCPDNVGFGKGHNECIKQILDESKYHLILNPDVYFGSGVIETLIQHLESDNKIGIISPKVLYPDGKIQYSCRQLPSPQDIVLRRVGILNKIFPDKLASLDLAFTEYNKTMEVPFLLGCFLLIPTKVFKEIGLFDERFFMYMEDFDLVRRVKNKYKTVFCPDVYINHVYERGSGKKIKLILYHVNSAWKYFNKWGWFFDKERGRFNLEIMKKFNYK